MIAGQRVSGLGKHQLKRLFISQFYNGEWLSTHQRNPYLLDLEENRIIKDFIFLDVLDFCIKTDVCKALNLSVLDLMELDLPTYTTIKETIRSENERKAKIIEEQQREMENKERQMLGGKSLYVPKRN